MRLPVRGLMPRTIARIYNRKLETLKEDSPATSETRRLWIVPLLGLLG